jgi:ASC-1-like (ASCH) protein
MQFNNNGIIIEILGKEVKIEYTENDIHFIGIKDIFFNAIKVGLKDVETRANSDLRPFDYSKIKVSDKIVFVNEQTGENLLTSVKRITHYKDSKTLLETEGTKGIVSKGETDIQYGIDLLNSFPGYKKGIEKYGIFAIGVKIINE